MGKPPNEQGPDQPDSLPFKDPKEPWVIKEDAGHLLQFNLPVIVLAFLLLGWQVGVLLIGASFSDLGWHQWRHDEHKGRRHVHIPLRIIGAVVIVVGLYLVRKGLGH